MKNIILYYIMIVFAVMAMAAETSVDSSDDNTRLLQGSCKSLLRRGKCRQRSDCVWQNGQCRRASGGGCRRITKKQQCNAKRNCEWRQQQQRCRRRVGGTTVSPPTTSEPITGGVLPASIIAALTSRLEKVGVVDACLCKNDHKPCVQATVNAIEDFIHGGNNCHCYELKLVGMTPTLFNTAEDNCVCANADTVNTPIFPYGGENCECFVI
mmetsp:Transcript_5709/g.9541  ORF Transcript_5709/g.9541 Transcript_5709/m.9541 type:complete len:211 (-) Transcript_5709:162-794(-)